MRDFPNLDDFSVTEYGDIHMVDPRVVDVLKVAGKAHIEYCYENDDMMCSIDSNPDDGKWRWMIIQKRPYVYMDDGNLGGTSDLMTAYAEARDAYVSHRTTMDNLRQRLNHDVVVQMPEDVTSPFDQGEWYRVTPPESQGSPVTSASQDYQDPQDGMAQQADDPMQVAPPYADQPTQGAPYRDAYQESHPTAWQDGHAYPTQPNQPASGYASFGGAGTQASQRQYPPAPQIQEEGASGYVEQTPLQAFDHFEDVLDRFFEQDEYEAQTAYPEHFNVEFGDDSYSVHEFAPEPEHTQWDDSEASPVNDVAFDFDMDIDEFLGLDSLLDDQPVSSGEHIDDMLAQMISDGLHAGSSRWGADIRGDPK